MSAPGGPRTPDDERTRRLRTLAIASGAALVLVVAAILISETDGDSETRVDNTADLTVFEGIEQDGLRLGEADAPLELHEFMDMQCPFCARFSHEVLPRLIEDYVRPGEASINLELLAFIGEDSEHLARVVLAAAEHDVAWQTAEVAFARQGPENSGYASDEFVSLTLAEAAGLTIDELELMAPSVDRELERARELADEMGVEGTPTIVAIAGESTVTLPNPLEYDEVREELDALLAGRG